MTFGLPEESVLLGLDDTTGKCISSYAQYAWTAAVLSELELAGRIDLTGSAIRVTSEAPTGDELLDGALATLATRPWKLTGAIRARLVSAGRSATIGRLVDAGILEYHDNRVLGIFHVRRYPAHDGKMEGALRERLRATVLNFVEPDARTRALLGIAAGSGLLRAFLSREERLAHRARVDTITAGSPVRLALSKVIEEDEAAVTTAAILAATS